MSVRVVPRGMDRASGFESPAAARATPLVFTRFVFAAMTGRIHRYHIKVRYR